MQALGTSRSHIAADASAGSNEAELALRIGLLEHLAPEDLIVLVFEVDSRRGTRQTQFGLEAFGGTLVECTLLAFRVVRTG